jgi:DNA-binding IclR family transcriptional regulator
VRVNPVSAILAALREAEYPLSVGELAERTGLPAYTLYGYLRGMTHYGDIVKTGRNPSQYSVPDDGASARTGT